MVGRDVVSGRFVGVVGRVGVVGLAVSGRLVGVAGRVCAFGVAGLLLAFGVTPLLFATAGCVCSGAVIGRAAATVAGLPWLVAKCCCGSFAAAWICCVCTAVGATCRSTEA